MSIKFFILVICSIVRDGEAIIGGENATDNIAPYRVSLRLTNDEGMEYHFAEGSIISENKILSSAGAIVGYNAEDFTAVVGMNTSASEDTQEQNDENDNKSPLFLEIYKKYLTCILGNALLSILPGRNFIDYANKFSPINIPFGSPTGIVFYSCDGILSEDSAPVGEQRHKIAKIIIHENYNNVSHKNDISLLYITDKFKFSATVQPISLATPPRKAGDTCLIVGGGSIDNDGTPANHLQMVDATIISLEKCNTIYKRVTSVLPITDSHVCVTYPKPIGQGVCEHDGGAALINNNQVVGVTSFVVPCAKGYPDVFTNVTHFVDWVESH